MNFLTNVSVVGGYLDLNKGEIRNAVVQQLGTAPSSPVEGQVYWNSSSHTLYVYNGSGWVSYYPSTTTLDAITAPASDVSANSHKITNVATPVSSTDAATKAYVDSAVAGKSWKDPVRAASTANVSVSSAPSSIDGVSLSNGDRVLLKDQTTATENGLYVFSAAGSALTRSTDANTGGLLLEAAVAVEEGTANGDTVWMCSTNGPITVGTTSIAFVRFSALAYTFTSGVTSSGSTVSANTDGTTITVNGSNQLQVVSGAFPKKYTTTITGNGSATSFAITHNLGTKDLVVQARGTNSPYTDTQVQVDVSYTSTSAISVSTASALASGVILSITVIG